MNPLSVALRKHIRKAAALAGGEILVSLVIRLVNDPMGGPLRLAPAVVKLAAHVKSVVLQPKESCDGTSFDPSVKEGGQAAVLLREVIISIFRRGLLRNAAGFLVRLLR